MAYSPDIPTNFKYTPKVPVIEPGLVVFAASWLLALGLLDVFYAITVIAGADIFIKESAWLVGDVEPWGWLMLIIGLIQLAAVPSILRGTGWGHWVGIASALGNMVAQMMFLSDSALVAILLLILDVMVIHALLVTRGGMPQAMKW